jgi:hypothetical protein
MELVALALIPVACGEFAEVTPQIFAKVIPLLVA